MRFKYPPRKLIRVWLRLGLYAAQDELLNHWGSILFLLGKVARFAIFFLFLFTILNSAGSMAGYSREQVILFFLVFNLVDTISQALFRGVYHFRPLVVQGDFDFDLAKPLPSYFRPLFGWTDILDLITMLPLWGFFLWFLHANHLVISTSQWLLFFLFLANSLILAFSFHLAVCAVCVLTTEIDHLVMIYRDLTNLVRFPAEIYPPLMQGLLTFVIPVIVLMAIPTKALVGLLSWQMGIISLGIAGTALMASLRFWRFSLTKYSSASS
ncbi:MAG: ABC-2 family transporter protein [bacterium]|nr:ABC-2 family transporter protein [bacterium]